MRDLLHRVLYGALPDHAMAAQIVGRQHFAGAAGMGGELGELLGFEGRDITRGERSVGLPFEIDPPAVAAEDHHIERT